MAEPTGRQSAGNEFSQSFTSNEAKSLLDSGRSVPVESVILSTDILEMEIARTTRRADEAAIGAGTDEVEDEQHETQRKRLEKTAKLLCGVALNLSVAIIIAVVANTNKLSSRSHRELILFKASAASALLTFFAGLGLLISVQYKNVKRTVQLGLIIIAILTILAGAVVLAMNVVF
ncbi:hypothetical protein MA16_Dca017717 [Dendrobium catenatum]|uniref:Uncharacterized protein n=1 Tax=Dendrobium catenatum TaxID=906689 RepID=A0A2I0VY71_9ASPA|nr:hypothetical protein MA16_Dca017717 [Dendrobium catenatum]